MKQIMLIAALVLVVSSDIALGQTWGERQQAYQEKANLETELFHQREDMERLQRETEQAINEQRREMETLRYERMEEERKQKLESWANSRD